MMTINEIQDEIIEEFSEFDDWMDKYQMLIDMGNDQPPLDDKYKTESNLIDGCQSRVWLQADYADGVITFSAESDALIVKGIVSLLIRVLSGHSPKEIMADILENIDGDINNLEEKILITASCKAAVKANTPLNIFQMEEIIARWRGCKNPYTCPHGRPISKVIKHNDIAAFFMRSE